MKKILKTRVKYTLVGSDFSQQEPRLLSQYSQDRNMINAYKSGKDLYSTIASGVYHNKYEDNLEFRPDGSLNVEGKKRRSNCKSILLGIMYGRGVYSIAEQIGSSVDEAQEIVDNFYKSFPNVKVWMDKTVEDALKNGYVEDLWGRRRRLPDLLLPKFEIKSEDDNKTTFNPFIECENRVNDDIQKKIIKYSTQLENSKYRKEVKYIEESAKKDGITIKDNRGYIAAAERQCVNARIQGGASTMTKIAMNKIYRDKELNELGFKLLIGVHDELIGECPEINREKVADRLTYVMRTCVEDCVEVPFKCDADICNHWYYNEYTASIITEYNKLLNKGLTKEQARDIIISEHIESNKDTILKIITDN